MEQIVPGVLQRLRAADIIRMAGLVAASLGQEYCRTGAVQNTQRQGARISGIVHVSPVASRELGAEGVEVDGQPQAAKKQHPYQVDVELQGPATWLSRCSCGAASVPLCAHGAALLYQWLARPASFVPITTTTPVVGPVEHERVIKMPGEEIVIKMSRTTEINLAPVAAQVARAPVLPRGPIPLGSLSEMLTLIGISELRSIAREYGIQTNNQAKQLLVSTLVEALKAPEAVRKVAATLEKPQRQLLATLILAGGALADDDLRGIFERFSLGSPAQFQPILDALQSKGLLFRTSLNSAPQQRISLSGSLFEVGWYVPEEIRTALRVAVPVTPFDHEQQKDEVHIQLAEPYRLLADLLLIARSLNNYQLGPDDEWLKRKAGTMAARAGYGPDLSGFSRSANVNLSDGSVVIPPPADLPSSELLTTLEATIKRPMPFLRFAIRLLRLADILHKDDSGTPYLRALPNAAQLLLSSTRTDVAHDLFDLWLTQSPYEDLLALQENGQNSLRLRCRATSSGMPIIRPGELEAENSEARQTLVALLAQVPRGHWVSFTAFARFVYRLNPLFLQRRQQIFPLPHWWIEQEEGRPLRPLQLNDWLRAEIYYLAHLIAGPLHWWGICDLTTSRDGRLLAFRLTPGSAWLLNGRAPDEEAKDKGVSTSEAPLLIAAADDELQIACSSHAWSLIEQVEALMQPVGVHDDRLCYRLSPRVLIDALSRGQSPRKLLDTLRSLAAEDSTQQQTLLRMIERLEGWLTSYGRVRLYTGVTLLEAADNVVMRELSATTTLDKTIVHTIHPTLHILKRADELIDELKRRGQGPLLHDEEAYGAK